MEGTFCSSWDMNSMYDHLIKYLCHSRWRLDINSSQPRDCVAQRKKLFHGATCDLAKSDPNKQESFESYLIMPLPILQPGKGS